MSKGHPSRGDVWELNLDPTIGHEQAGTRPALVLSIDQFNQGPSEMVIVLPITSKDKKQLLHVGVSPPEGGLTMRSFIKCDNVRSVSSLRLRRYVGKVSAQTLGDVEKRMRMLLNL
jgi:mRNA interferase MazF